MITSGEIEAEHRILSGSLVVRNSARLPKHGIIEQDDARISRPKNS